MNSNPFGIPRQVTLIANQRQVGSFQIQKLLVEEAPATKLSKAGLKGEMTIHGGSN